MAFGPPCFPVYVYQIDKMKPFSIKILLKGLSVLACALFSFSSVASVVIGGTRVIYDANESEVTVKLSNQGVAPALIQTWIDDGNASASPSSVSPPPFTVTPPIARIDPGKGQTLRILYTGDPLPQDKESVFWLNVVEIAPKPKAEDSDVNYLQLAFRSRIKLFFRPSGLKGIPADAPAKIIWRFKEGEGRRVVEAVNPTPYHVTFAALYANSGDKKASFTEGGMVNPGETRLFPLTGDDLDGRKVQLHYQAINDYGGTTEGDVDIDLTVPAGK